MRQAFAIPAHWQPYPSDPPHTVLGDLLWWPHCPMAPVARSRTLFVWLPPSYRGSDRRYPIIYLMDAQNVFDAALAFAGIEWQVDETMHALGEIGTEAIVVAVNHAGRKRVGEYTPWENAGGYGERFLDWLTGPLKSRIDNEFRTVPHRDATTIAGSSMGGLISLYAFVTRSNVYGSTGVFSPALWVNNQAIFDTVARHPLPPGRIYLDCGSREPTARPMADLLRRKGARDGHSLLYLRETGGRHDEAAWARRFPNAVRFLLNAPAVSQPAAEAVLSTGSTS